MTRAVLFDIDNTLVFFDESLFFEEYMRRLAPFFEDLWPPDEFRGRMLSSVRALLENDGTRTNAERFLDRFSRGLDGRRGDLWERFERFYAGPFEGLRSLVRPQPGAGRVLESVRAGSALMVAASNPVWPLSAQEKRLAWAGVGGFPFDRITHIENSGFCKPSLDYYREIARSLGVAPEECLMVGNDPVNDLVTARLGMKTFLVTDAAGDAPLNLGPAPGAAGADCIPDFRGPLSEVPGALRTLNK